MYEIIIISGHVALTSVVSAFDNMERKDRIFTFLKMFLIFMLVIVSCVYGQQIQPGQQQIPIQQQGQVQTNDFLK